jgi:hypothetical protein
MRNTHHVSRNREGLVIMKGVLIVLGAIVFAVVLAGGGFLAGVNIGKAQAQDAQTNFFRQRGFDPNAAGGTGAGGQGAGAARRGVTGTIEKVEGNLLTVSSTQGETVTVQLADDTPIQKTVAGSKSDLTVGANVLVVGTRSGNNVAPTDIQLTNGAGLGGLFGGGAGGGRRATPTP